MRKGFFLLAVTAAEGSTYYGIHVFEIVKKIVKVNPIVREVFYTKYHTSYQTVDFIQSCVVTHRVVLDFVNSDCLLYGLKW